MVRRLLFEDATDLTLIDELLEHCGHFQSVCNKDATQRIHENRIP
jgi:hypothetical protein